MNRILLALLLISFSVVCATAADAPAAETPEWSKPVKGLRARLFTEPSHEPQYDKTYDVWIAFQEVGLDTSLGVQHQAVTIRFSLAQLTPTVTTTKGEPVAETPIPTDGVTTPTAAVMTLTLPANGKMRFPIGHGGSRLHQGPPGVTPPKGKLMQLETLGEWLLLFENGPHHLLAKFNVDPSHSEDTPNPQFRTWDGTLLLPMIELPKDG